jgi:23S rRNA (cytosine1962-C5)-methyltransferase
MDFPVPNTPPSGGSPQGASSFEERLAAAIDARAGLFDAKHETAFRLFNGFSEGCPSLAVDAYARTAVLHDYSSSEAESAELSGRASSLLAGKLPWLDAILLKKRGGLTQEERNGVLLSGSKCATRILEGGVKYAVDLRMNRDCGFYLDTRKLRKWAVDSLKGLSVLNTFAYTGSLGVAALYGGASRVLQLDLNKRFLNQAKASCGLNGLPLAKMELLCGDFWPLVSRLKRSGERFDCVFLDPPFFSATAKGVLDLAADSARLVNKLRPLVNDGGKLVSVNNALFLSGRDYLDSLEALCRDGYLKVSELIQAPDDFAGFGASLSSTSAADPAPFKHSTKIAILEVRRKDASPSAAKR